MADATKGHSMSALRALLDPKAIAVVGASPRPGPSARVISNLRDAGFKGGIFGVNPRYPDVLGYPCVPSVRDLPASVECIVIAVAAETAAGVISGASPFGFLIARLVAGGVKTDVLINALEEKGIARSLAEPNLVALSGDTASFLAGGEYPIPVSGSFGQITVDYKKYGVGLAFTPTVLGRGLINLKIEPEVSQIDTTHTVSVSNGVAVPALIVRRASTTVELRDGQSFVIGGLLQSDNKNAIEQLPWLGSIPVLGTLFSSKSYQKNETDLAIIVTPRLVRPARPGDEIKAPTDDTLPPNDVDFFLMGKNEITREQARKLTPATARVAVAADKPFTGHMIDLPKGESNATIQ